MLIKCAPAIRKIGTVPVYLNVYDISSINGCTSVIGLGMYHSGIQVHDVEYAFGAHESESSGIFECEPRKCPGFTFKKSILIGWTIKGPKDVWGFMEDMAEEYKGNTYHLITRNCNHFCKDACMRLTGNRIPSWVNRLAKIGLMFNCIFPKNVDVERVRHKSKSDVENKKKKARRNSISGCPSPPSFDDGPDSMMETARSNRRVSSLSAPPFLVSSAMLNI
ncbi:hypothetical protein AAC387_Pa05g2520 [Persea americana]